MFLLFIYWCKQKKSQCYDAPCNWTATAGPPCHLNGVARAGRMPFKDIFKRLMFCLLKHSSFESPQLQLCSVVSLLLRWDLCTELVWLFLLIHLLGGGVQMGPLSTAGTDWPIVACPGWLWWWRIWWNEEWQGKPKYSEKTCPSTTLSTTNPTWPDPGSTPGLLGGKPAANCLSYGAAWIRSWLTNEWTLLTELTYRRPQYR
jgi:hypothetical protein